MVFNHHQTITKRLGSSSISKLLAERLLRVSPLISSWASLSTRVNFIKQHQEGNIFNLLKTLELIQYTQMIKCKRKFKIHDRILMMLRLFFHIEGYSLYTFKQPIELILMHSPL